MLKILDIKRFLCVHFILAGVLLADQCSHVAGLLKLSVIFGLLRCRNIVVDNHLASLTLPTLDCGCRFAVLCVRRSVHDPFSP